MSCHGAQSLPSAGREPAFPLCAAEVGEAKSRLSSSLSQGPPDPERHFPPFVWASFSHFSSPLGHILSMEDASGTTGPFPPTHCLPPPLVPSGPRGSLSVSGEHVIRQQELAGTQPLRTTGSAGPTATARSLPRGQRLPGALRERAVLGERTDGAEHLEAAHLRAEPVQRERRDGDRSGAAWTELRALLIVDGERGPGRLLG